MALSIVKELLKHYVQSLVDEGIVNGFFSQKLISLKTLEEHDHVVQLINGYCINIEAILLEIAKYENLSDVDFTKLAPLAKKMEENSSHIGAQHMRLACSSLVQACQESHQTRFFNALSWVKNEFSHTGNKLMTIVQMERKIMRIIKSRQ